MGPACPHSVWLQSLVENALAFMVTRGAGGGPPKGAGFRTNPKDRCHSQGSTADWPSIWSPWRLPQGLAPGGVPGHLCSLPWVPEERRVPRLWRSPVAASLLGSSLAAGPGDLWGEGEGWRLSGEGFRTRVRSAQSLLSICQHLGVRRHAGTRA